MMDVKTKPRRTVALRIATATKAAKTPNDYLAMVDADKPSALNKLRQAIKAAAPDAKASAAFLVVAYLTSIVSPASGSIRAIAVAVEE